MSKEEIKEKFEKYLKKYRIRCGGIAKEMILRFINQEKKEWAERYIDDIELIDATTTETEFAKPILKHILEKLKGRI